MLLLDKFKYLISLVLELEGTQIFPHLYGE